MQVNFKSFMSEAGIVAAFFVSLFLFSDVCIALTDADFREEITRAEKLITGGYLRLGLFGMCFIAGGIAIVKQNWMMLVAAASGVLFIYMMKGWVTSNFAILI
ncbi:MAG: hypothetical protein ACRCYP_05740 [Alphaproteobacteria bacterium]